jgi:glycine/serine hydroxymethyltransferase
VLRALIKHILKIDSIGAFFDNIDTNEQQNLIKITQDYLAQYPYLTTFLSDISLEKKINRGVFPGVQGGPFDHVLVAKATSFLEILDPATNWS